MTLNKTHFIVFIVGAVLGLLSGFFIGKAIYDRPLDTKIERDTVVRYDTTFRYYPKPVEVEKTRTEYKWLTRVVTDTVKEVNFLHTTDSVLVEVPIESKHYHAQDYDAWVSGYNPSLDSIRTYQRTEYITETVTKVVKEQKHFFLDISGGCEYIPNTKTTKPFAQLGFSFKPGRFAIGAFGGYSHDLNENKATPYIKAKITYDIITF